MQRKLFLPPISIHALLAESDVSSLNVPSSCRRFLSTLSLRRATRRRSAGRLFRRKISIHALLAESDRSGQRQRCRRKDFYPRSPCGERPPFSTALRPAANISIHALLAESDQSSLTSKTRQMDFYPRSPCGERPG